MLWLFFCVDRLSETWGVCTKRQQSNTCFPTIKVRDSPTRTSTHLSAYMHSCALANLSLLHILHCLLSPTYRAYNDYCGFVYCSNSNCLGHNYCCTTLHSIYNQAHITIISRRTRCQGLTDRIMIIFYLSQPLSVYLSVPSSSTVT